jgi:hypothetical protein
MSITPERMFSIFVWKIVGLIFANLYCPRCVNLLIPSVQYWSHSCATKWSSLIFHRCRWRATLGASIRRCDATDSGTFRFLFEAKQSRVVAARQICCGRAHRAGLRAIISIGVRYGSVHWSFSRKPF